MNIRTIARKAIERGFLELSMELALESVLDQSALEDEEYEALVKLEEAIRAGRVHTVGRRSCVNAMEQVVRREIVSRVEAGELQEDREPDLCEVAAHALFMLPARYATSDEGLTLQLQEIRADLLAQVREAVDQSIAVCRQTLARHLEHKPLTPAIPGVDIVGLISHWQSQVGGM